ncbi:MAG: AbrB/MazE/SpoVT family DNA-binding domain-containing protein [Promethearchaeota archaeon]
MRVRKIGKHGRLVIPRNIMKLASIKSGDTVKFSLADNQIVIEKVKGIETFQEIHNVHNIQEKSMVALLMQDRPFVADLTTTLRNEWE